MESEFFNDPNTACYIIYTHTVFLRKTLFGFKAVPDHRGVERELPSNQEIRKALKKRKIALKSERFTMQRQTNGWEALSGYGIQAGNITGRGFDVEMVKLILAQDDVDCLYWVNGERVYFVEREDVPVVQTGNDSDG